jgi:hypothetical protein
VRAAEFAIILFRTVFGIATYHYGMYKFAVLAVLASFCSVEKDAERGRLTFVENALWYR